MARLGLLVELLGLVELFPLQADRGQPQQRLQLIALNGQHGSIGGFGPVEISTAQENVGSNPVDLGIAAGGYGLKKRERFWCFSASEERPCPNGERLRVPGLSAEDEVHLRVGFVPGAELEKHLAQIDGDRHGVGGKLLGPRQLAPRVEEPGASLVCATEGVQRRNEVGVDLEGVPELDDRFVVLSLPQVHLATRERFLLLRLRTLGTGREHEREQTEERDAPSATSGEEAWAREEWNEWAPARRDRSQE